MSRFEQLIEKAVAKAQLDDFGADDFREGLEILVSALDDEARLNDVGRHVLDGKLVKLLTYRLEIEDWYKRHPEIDDEVIETPLFGVGLPRTGSTALGNLLNEDPDARSLASWVAMQPVPPPGTVVGEDPRIAEAQKTIDLQMQFAPQLATMVPTGAHAPAECLELMALNFASHVFTSLAQVPSYVQWLLHDADMVATYRYEKRALKMLQWKLPQRPWRLKAPSHLPHIDALAEVFPDARIVATHRDPAKIMPSVNGLYETTIAMFTDAPDRRYIGRQNLDVWSLGMQRMIDFRAGGGESRCYDLDHAAVQRDPIAAVEGLYDWMGRPVTDEFRAGMQHWWQDNAAERPQASYATLEEFGLDADAVRERFADYVGRFVA